MRQFNIFIILIIGFMMSHTAVYADTDMPDILLDNNEGYIVDATGLYIALPETNGRQLVEQIKILNNSLEQREEELRLKADGYEMGAKDALITAIMPGGLLYAAYKKSAHEQAMIKLSRITEERAELAHDLLVMQEREGELMLAVISQ